MTRRLANAVSVLVLTAAVLPLPVLAVTSFCRGRFPAFPWAGWSVRWYHELAFDRPLHGALVASLGVGFLTAVVGTILGFGSGYWLSRIDEKGRAEALLLGLVLPTLFPFLVFAFAFSYAMRIGGLTQSLLWVVVAHTVVFSPVATALFFRRFGQLERSIEDAARDLGASEARVLLIVVGGQTWRTGVSVFLAIMVLSWDEYVISWFVSGAFKTYPVLVRNMLESTMSPEIAAVGMLTALLSMGFAVVALRLWRLREAR